MVPGWGAGGCDRIVVVDVDNSDREAGRSASAASAASISDLELDSGWPVNDQRDSVCLVKWRHCQG